MIQSAQQLQVYFPYVNGSEGYHVVHNLGQNIIGVFQTFEEVFRVSFQ